MREKQTLRGVTANNLVTKQQQWQQIKGKSRVYLGGFPDGSDGKESACNVGDPGSIPESGRSPGEGNDSPLQYFCLENSMDRCYNPWGHKESEMTKQLTEAIN